MKSYRQNMRFEDISSHKIVDSSDFLLGFETEKSEGPVFLFFLKSGKFYPVIHKNEAADSKRTNKSLTGMVSDNFDQVVKVFLGIRGLNNLNFVEKLLLLKHSSNIGNFPKSFAGLRKFAPLLELPDVALQLLARNRLSPEIGLKMTALPINDINFILKLITDFNLNMNHQREIFSYFADMSRADKKPFHKLIDLTKLASIANPSQKAEAILDCLREISMPEFHKTLRRFNNLKNKLGLPAKVNLTETPFFESKTFKIELFFKSYEELNKRIQALKSAAQNKKEVWEEIFSCV